MTEYEEHMLALAEAQLTAQRRSASYLGVLTAITVTLLALSIIGVVFGLIVGLHS